MMDIKIFIGIVIAFFFGASSMIWNEANGEEIPYLAEFYRAEIMYSLPNNLLIEVARQESGFRQDVINCSVSSSAGAMGIMQIIPRYHPVAEPCNPPNAILYSARYLQHLYNLTGTWQGALASYYWGIGNVRTHIRNNRSLDTLPPNVKKYAREILTRVSATQVCIGVTEK